MSQRVATRKKLETQKLKLQCTGSLYLMYVPFSSYVSNLCLKI